MLNYLGPPLFDVQAANLYHLLRTLAVLALVAGLPLSTVACFHMMYVHMVISAMQFHDRTQQTPARGQNLAGVFVKKRGLGGVLLELEWHALGKQPERPCIIIVLMVF